MMFLQFMAYHHKEEKTNNNAVLQQQHDFNLTLQAWEGKQQVGYGVLDKRAALGLTEKRRTRADRWAGTERRAGSERWVGSERPPGVGRRAESGRIGGVERQAGAGGWQALHGLVELASFTAAALINREMFLIQRENNR
jgi:hypothetical protein